MVLNYSKGGQFTQLSERFPAFFASFFSPETAENLIR
jgi:hypothetical protein